MVTDHEDKKNILETFDEITLDLIYSDIEMAKQLLEDEGFDHEKELQHGVQSIKKIQFLIKAQKNIIKDKKLLKLAFDKLKTSIAENAEKTGLLLKELLQSKTPAFQYRKLEEWTDDEIREVLNDVDIIRLLEELENNE